MGQKQAKNHHDSFGKSRLPRAALPVSLELGIFRAVCDLIAFVSEVLPLLEVITSEGRKITVALFRGDVHFTASSY